MANRDQKLADCIEAVNSIIGSLTGSMEHDNDRENKQKKGQDFTPRKPPTSTDDKLRQLLQHANVTLTDLSSLLLQQTKHLQQVQRECSSNHALMGKVMGNHQQALERAQAATRNINDCLEEEGAANLPLRPDEVVEYLTDVEGNWDYFLKWLDYSRALRLENGKLVMLPKTYFVFGGDAVDKGTGDIRFVKAMLQLKKTYPDRVFLIMGNRDFNKLRLSAELAEGLNGNDCNPYWDPNIKSYDEFLEEQKLEDGSVATLKYILDCTMGAKTTFEFRREELGILRPGTEITDEDVLESFRSSMDLHGKDPWMLEFLRMGNLMMIIGDIVFVHGGIVKKEHLCQVPGSAQAQKCSLERWATQLNSFYTSQIHEFERMPKWVGSGAQKRRGGTALMDYGVPNGNGGNTVVYTGFKGKNGPGPMEPAVSEYMTEQGACWLVIGHQPQGIAPTVIADNGINILCCDTSYSDVKSKPDLRGKCVTHVSLTNTQATLRGVLDDGSEHLCTVPAPRLRASVDENSANALIGRELPTGRWVKTVCSDGKLLVAKADGWKWVLEHLTVDEVKAQLA